MRIYQNLLECNLTSGTNIGCLYMHFLHSHFLRFSSNLLLIAPVLSLDLFCKLTRDKRLKRGQIKVCSRADRSWKGVDCRDTQKCFLLRWVTIAPILHIFERLVVYSRLFEWIDGPLARGAAGSRNALVRQLSALSWSREWEVSGRQQPAAPAIAPPLDPIWKAGSRTPWWVQTASILQRRL